MSSAGDACAVLSAHLARRLPHEEVVERHMVTEAWRGLFRSPGSVWAVFQASGIEVGCRRCCGLSGFNSECLRLYVK